nr:tripartite tricarboxylate transporter substrate-binding protein [Comamonas koreensis]
MVVENRGGAGGLLGAEVVTRAQADGYTVLIALYR